MTDYLVLFGAVLAVVALCDRRLWPYLAVIGAVWLATSALEQAPDRLAGIWLRLPVDSAALAVCLLFRNRSRAGWIITALYGCAILNHAAYWLCYVSGVNLWTFYAHSINALWLLQLMVAGASGGQALVGFVGDVLRGPSTVGRPHVARRAAIRRSRERRDRRTRGA